MEKDVACHHPEGHFQWDDYSCYDNKGRMWCHTLFQWLWYSHPSAELTLPAGNPAETSLRHLLGNYYEFSSHRASNSENSLMQRASIPHFIWAQTDSPQRPKVKCQQPVNASLINRDQEERSSQKTLTEADVNSSLKAFNWGTWYRSSLLVECLNIAMSIRQNLLHL